MGGLGGVVRGLLGGVTSSSRSNSELLSRSLMSLSAARPPSPSRDVDETPRRGVGRGWERG